MFNKESYDLWKQRIHEQRTSGMKIREWCEKNQLSPHAYYYWRKLISTHKNVLTDSNTTAFVIDAYLPWSKDLPQECRLNKRLKKEFR